jgi:hypothetical protein
MKSSTPSHTRWSQQWRSVPHFEIICWMCHHLLVHLFSCCPWVYDIIRFHCPDKGVSDNCCQIIDLKNTPSVTECASINQFLTPAHALHGHDGWSVSQTINFEPRHTPFTVWSKVCADNCCKIIHLKNTRQERCVPQQSIFNNSKLPSQTKCATINQFWTTPHSFHRWSVPQSIYFEPRHTPFMLGSMVARLMMTSQHRYDNQSQ